MRNVTMVVDLQFGSTGKGLIAGYLAEERAPDTLITAWGPNAGHTYIDSRGNKYVNIALPNGIVSPRLKRILLGPGSLINPSILNEEIERYDHLLEGVELLIHEHAAVVMQKHRDAEAEYGFKIGSTMKGVGEALVSKIRRAEGNIAGNHQSAFPMGRVVSVSEYNMAVDEAEEVLIEGSQGFSLSINQGFYPYCTSRDCTVQQLFVDCALPAYWIDDVDVVGVCRTYPIRVANRFKDGVQVGTSGPCYPDQREMDWSELGLEPELTTVTKLPRRIFTFSEIQIAEACRMNSVDFVFLNFCNYMMTNELNTVIDTIQRYAPVRWLGMGPKSTDIHEGPNKLGRV